MGTKGTWRRPAAISPAEEQAAWERVFGRRPPPEKFANAGSFPAGDRAFPPRAAWERVFGPPPSFAAHAAAGCCVPPPGWYCSRAPGHDGPCAARQIQGPCQCTAGWVCLTCAPREVARILATIAPTPPTE